MAHFRTSRVLAGCIAVAVVAAGGTACGGQSRSHATQYCALMSDSVGLYAGNPVTQMGYKIGSVDKITPEATGVEVAFSVTEDRSIPHDVKAVTRSTSILADRALELVGNYSSGPRLAAHECIPRDRTATPLSISQVIGAATNFVNGVNPHGSTNIQDALRGVDEAVNGNGANLNTLLTKTSSLLDNPDQAIADVGSIVRNVVQLTETLKQSRPPLKEILLELKETTPYLVNTLAGVSGLIEPLGDLVFLASQLEIELGDDIQLGLDTAGDLLRHFSPHYKGLANILNPVPRFINTFSSYVNNHEFDAIAWSPPLFRIRTPDGLALCGAMNASMPGSCADVNGQPHAVDVALLQYVLTEAQRR